MGERELGLVSVVIPTYNVGSMVREAVDSVLEQTYPLLEALVIDDGSTDDTMTYLHDIEDPRLRIVSKPNGGVSSARNLGAQVARGEFVAFLDADDVWTPTKLEETVPLLAEHVAVGSMMRYIDEQGRRLRSAAGEDPTVGDAPARIPRAELMPFQTSSIVFQADAVAQAGEFDTTLRLAQDLDFFARVARLGSVGYVPKALGGYRLRTSSVSSRDYARQRKNMRFIQARLRARDAGGDLTWEDFDRDYAPSFRTRRLDYAAEAYRAGGLALSQGHRSGALHLLGAVAASPGYSVPRLVRHVRAMRG
ncbi:glycosyltransferase [Demequina sp.]|uniref:glycosyltransferase family 2 protein n=1 Tax=Demequina sp. TaxID=2050685 RepID=UPI0025D50F11|nr:glycosyltransferase [Demequina sp.]